MPISRDIGRRATADPGRTALIRGSERVSFGDLAGRATTRATALGQSGAATSPIACGASDTASDRGGGGGFDPVNLLIELVAIDQLRATAVVADPSWPQPVREAALTEAGLATDSSGGNGGTPTGSSLVVFTSGSSGTPRPVVRTTTSWTYSFPTFSAFTQIGPDDTVLIPGRLTGSLFLFGAVHALTMGAAVHLLPHWSPTAAAAAAESCTAVHLVPSMLGTFIAAPGRLRTAVCAGARLAPEAVAAAGDAGIDVVEYYGAAELSLVAIRRPNPTGSRKPMRPFPGVEVRVRDGVLHARSPYVAGSTPTDADGFATVGDRATFTEDGGIEIVGRPDTAITTGGSTVYAEGVERLLRLTTGDREVAVVGLPHPDLGQVVTAVLEGSDGLPRLAELRAHTSERLVPAERPRRWLVVDRLPRTASGKVARTRLVDGLAAGTVAAERLT